MSSGDGPAPSRNSTQAALKAISTLLSATPAQYAKNVELVLPLLRSLDTDFNIPASELQASFDAKQKTHQSELSPTGSRESTIHHALSWTSGPSHRLVKQLLAVPKTASHNLSPQYHYSVLVIYRLHSKPTKNEEEAYVAIAQRVACTVKIVLADCGAEMAKLNVEVAIWTGSATNGRWTGGIQRTVGPAVSVETAVERMTRPQSYYHHLVWVGVGAAGTDPEVLRAQMKTLSADALLFVIQPHQMDKPQSDKPQSDMPHFDQPEALRQRPSIKDGSNRIQYEIHCVHDVRELLQPAAVFIHESEDRGATSDIAGEDGRSGKSMSALRTSIIFWDLMQGAKE